MPAINIVRPSLTKYQEEIIYNPERITVVLASTKVGKTHGFIWSIFEEAHAKGNQSNKHYWWVAPVYSQAEIAFLRLKEKLKGISAYEINQTKLAITTPLGSVINFKSGEHPDNLYGDDVYYAVLDEAPRMKVEAFYAVRSTVTKTKGKVKLIGNYGGANNWMTKLSNDNLSNADYKIKKITCHDAVEAGILTQEDVDAARADYPPSVFKTLYLAEDGGTKDNLVTQEAINDLWTNSHVKDGVKVITSDIAFMGSDLFVNLVWSGDSIIDSVVMERSNGAQIESTIKMLAERHGVGRSNIIYDSDGVGMYLSGYLQGARPYHSKMKANENYSNMNAQCSYLLAKKINERNIFIADPKLKDYKRQINEQLLCLVADKIDKEGKLEVMKKEAIKKIIGCSPDFLDAMKMKMILESGQNISASYFEFV
jgi:hypothetical protein